MESPFLVHVESLRGGHTCQISETAPSDLFDMHEKDLSLVGTVEVEGQAYFAGDELVLHLKPKATAEIPCTICNAPIQVEVEVPPFTEVIPPEGLKGLRGGHFDFTDLIREEILLNCPPFTECHGGKCPERQVVAHYLKEHHDGVRPFADLDEHV